MYIIQLLRNYLSSDVKLANSYSRYSKRSIRNVCSQAWISSFATMVTHSQRNFFHNIRVRGYCSLRSFHPKITNNWFLLCALQNLSWLFNFFAGIQHHVLQWQRLCLSCSSTRWSTRYPHLATRPATGSSSQRVMPHPSFTQVSY